MFYVKFRAFYMARTIPKIINLMKNLRKTKKNIVLNTNARFKVNNQLNKTFFKETVEVD